MTIRPRTIELIAKYLAGELSRKEIVDILERFKQYNHDLFDNYSDSNLIYITLLGLSQSNLAKNKDILYEILKAFVHPLTMGSDHNARVAVISINEWLKYDDKEISLIKGPKGKLIVNIDDLSEEPPQSDIEDEIDEYQIKAIEKIQEDKSLLLNLKYGYKLLIDIVMKYVYGNKFPPEEKLNFYYLKTVKLIEKFLKDIYPDSGASGHFVEATMLAGDLYKPFNNLYSGTDEYKVNYFDDVASLAILKKMNKYYSEVLKLCFDCDIDEESAIPKELGIYLKEVYIYINKGKALTTNKKFRFDEDESKIFINDEVIDIPYASNQYDLCKLIFSKIVKRWENDEILVKFGITDFNKENARKPYDAMIAINKKIKKMTGLEEFILYKDKTYRINPKHLIS